MAKQIEQSRSHAVSESSSPLDAPEAPISPPPTLRLVGGTDVTPKPLDPLAPPRT
jgi:hypothetical protein